MASTIAACSSGSMPCAIAIVRLSGSECETILARVFRAKNGKPLAHRVLTFGHVIDGETIYTETMAYSYNYLLSGSYIGSTAHDLYRFALSQVHSSNMHVVRIRMRFASQHFADDDTFQTTLDCLDFFYAPSFKTDRGQRSRHFFRSQIEVNVFFQPIIRDIHIGLFLLFS